MMNTSRKFEGRSLCLVALLVTFFTLGCSPEGIWGTEEHFEMMTGVKFAAEEHIYDCRASAFPDIAVVHVLRIPEEAAKEFRSPKETFREYPKQLEYEKKYTLATWKTGDLDERGEELFEVAMRTVRYVGRKGECKYSSPGINIENMVVDSMKRKNRHYAYQYLLTSGGLSYLGFYIIDADNGLYIEISDTM
jgi:hypothetical protein